MNITEQEFLKNYDPNEFERLSITTDILMLSVSSEESTNYRKTDKKNMSVLLVKRDNHPFKDKWCLPGGFVNYSEDLEKAPIRILKAETNIDNIYLEQLYTFGDVKRDPRMRVISTSYMALVDKNRIDGSLKENASWFDITILEDDNIVDVSLDNNETTIHFKIKKILMDRTTDRFDYEVMGANELAFDHAKVIMTGIARLRNKVKYTDVVFNMMPQYFTLGELQQVYEVILNKKLLDPAFRRIIEPKVYKTDKVKTGGGHRPSALFEYKQTGK